MTQTTFENQHGKMAVYDSGAIHFMPYDGAEEVIYAPTWITCILTSDNGRIRIIGTRVYHLKDDTETLIPDFDSLTIKADHEKFLIVHNDGTIETERGIGYEVGLATTAAIYKRYAYIMPLTLSDGTVIDLDCYDFLEAIADVGYLPHPFFDLCHVSLDFTCVAFDVPMFSQIKATAEIINRHPEVGIIFEKGDVYSYDTGETAIIYFQSIPWPEGHPPYVEFEDESEDA